MNLKLESLKCLPILAVVLLKCWRLIVTCLVFFIFVYWLFGALFAFLILNLAIAVCFFLTQDYLLFHPDDNNYQSRRSVLTPTSVQLPFLNLFVRSLDGTLIHMFFIRQPEPAGSSAPTLVFFHGNAGNMGHRLQNAAGLYSVLACNILMVEYRGYGLSHGYASERGIYMDAQAAMDYLAARTDVNQNRIIVFGRSLGGAVAIDLAARADYGCKIWCLIVENTFTSIPEITSALFKYKWLKFVPLFAYKNKLMSKDKVDAITVPTLFISGLSDTLVPPWMMTELHSRCSSPFKQLLQLPTGGHNDTWACHNYYASIASFLKAASSYTPSPPASSVENV
ncbi:Abhydrolase domain-containing protein [Nesidiocoris tenuis]|uniref:Abhydrolase domain-containing protein n=1 Tax=Nesidiocoris tenuis TaxID=355587 RepID=A0ABN7BE90_9HEMI|nr:Abhydrolase domain-containing protein [Nesidiocoris tenuis]